MSITSGIPLFDHHCHGLIQRRLALDEFALLATEGEWLPDDRSTAFNSPFGIAMRKICAPLLGLSPSCSIEDYVAARQARSYEALAAPLLAGTGTAEYGIETGFPSPDIASPAEMQRLTGAQAHTIVRLEAIAEATASETSAARFFDEFCARLDRQISRGAIGVKTVSAYRFGLDLPAISPTRQQLTSALDDWYHTAEQTRRYRLTDRVIIGSLVWAAIERSLAIQVHVGFGDTDVQLNTADPSHLTPLLRNSQDSGARFALLHCYPFLRQAAVLAHTFPHVYFDASCVSHYAGPSARNLVAEAFEVAPFSRILYASDAYGIPEHYAVSAALWREGVDQVLSTWIAEDFLTSTQAETISADVAHRNAHRLYELQGQDS